MRINIGRVRFSNNDIRRGISIPTVFTSELAEDVGFHIGDGYMKERKDCKKFELRYSGNNPDDIDYFENVLIPRKKNLFKIKNVEIYYAPSNNGIALKLQSKAILTFFRDVLRIKESPKINISVPKWIFSSTEFQKSFLRGLFDSDGFFTIKKRTYPVIGFSTQSSLLMIGTAKLLKNVGFSSSPYFIRKSDNRTNKQYKSYCIELNGRANVEKWMKYIGFRNTKHVKKYEKWAEAESNSTCLSKR